MPPEGTRQEKAPFGKHYTQTFGPGCDQVFLSGLTE